MNPPTPEMLMSPSARAGERIVTLCMPRRRRALRWGSPRAARADAPGAPTRAPVLHANRAPRPNDWPLEQLWRVRLARRCDAGGDWPPEQVAGRPRLARPARLGLRRPPAPPGPPASPRAPARHTNRARRPDDWPPEQL